MEFKDFKIGMKFYTATSQWEVTDVGTRTVIAHKVKSADKIANWDVQDNQIFYWYDFGGCSLQPFEDSL